MLAYNVPFFKEGDVEAFLTAVARVNGRVKKVRLSCALFDDLSLFLRLGDSSK